MTDQDLWNQWVEPFDLFVSYARKDNEGQPPMITALVEKIEADFARYWPGVPLKPFFDKRSIPDGKFWQDEIRRGLRQSKVMLAVLSEAYFQSEWCRREWEEYLLVEQARTYPGEALTPIFIIDPGDLARKIPQPARAWWQDITARNGVVEIHPFWPQGLAALEQELVEKRLQVLEQNVLARLEHGRLLAAVPRNIRGRNPNFVGRSQQLAALAVALPHETVGICAVNGVGGVGKSALAREYAYVSRRKYLGGQFEIDLSTIRDIRAVQAKLVDLARDYLKVDIPPSLAEQAQYARAKAAFESLTAPALLILDNLDEEATGLVGRQHRDALPSPEKVHLLVTTRAEPRSLGGIQAFPLDVLPTADALDLLFRFRAFAFDPADPAYQRARAADERLAEFGDIPPDEEWKAAVHIVHRLGRHTLAVTLVAAHLGTYPNLSYADFAHDLAEHGIGGILEGIGNDEWVRSLIQHPETLIGPLFERSVARLSPLALRILEYAAFLPPDLIPVAWIKQLVAQDADMAGRLVRRPGKPAPWDDALRTLEGLQYLVGARYARMHRVVQEVVRQRMDTEYLPCREKAVILMAEHRAWEVDACSGIDGDEREMAALAQFIRGREHSTDERMGRIAGRMFDLYVIRGNLRTARELGIILCGILSRIRLSNPSSAQAKRDLLVSLSKLGDVSRAGGDLAAAKRYFERSLQTHQELAAADPLSAEAQRDLSVSLDKLGEVSSAGGDLAAAKRYFERSLQIRQELADADASFALAQRDLSISLSNLGDVSRAGFDLAAAKHYFERSLQMNQELADADPSSAQAKRDLSISLARLGGVSRAGFDLAAAKRYFERSLQIGQELADADPSSAIAKRDLWVSLENLGNVSSAGGDLAAAKRYFERSLQISQELADADRSSAQARRDVWISHSRVADLLEKLSDATAVEHWQAALDILAGMVEAGLHVSPDDLQQLAWLRKKLGG